MKHKYLIILLLAFFTASSIAQQKEYTKLNLNLQNASVEEFARAIEYQVKVHFYYDFKELDSLRINLIVSNELLENTLKKALANSGVFYTIDDEKNIFLSKGKALQFVLPADFFKGNLVLSPDYDADGEQAAIWENKLYEVGKNSNPVKKSKYTLSGIIKDAQTAEPVIGAALTEDLLKTGTITDKDGNYSMELPPGRHTLLIRSVGIPDTYRQVYIHGDGKLNIEIKENLVALDDIIVIAQRESNIKNTAMGMQKVDIKTIKQVPVVFGEADILKVITTLPGVKTVGEASTGLNVRGGSADQNLILYNESPVYNPSHFFGMFSAFNPEIVKDVELFKSSIPARYGGRLSSVLNINATEGNPEKITGSAGIGLLTSRFNIEGPLRKNKTTFVFGARTTYANWLLKKLPSPYDKSSASFYDVNLNINHEFNPKNSLHLTTYLSQDKFSLGSDTLFGYGNRNASLKWKHSFSDKLNSELTTGYTFYNYHIASQIQPQNAYQLGFDIAQKFAKAHFSYYLSERHKLEFGLNSQQYKLNPGSYLPYGDQSIVKEDRVATEQALENALYASDNIEISEKLSLDAGVRFALFSYLGPHLVNQYPADLPRSENNLLQSVEVSKGIIKNYGAPEFRFSARYILNKNTSIKAGFNSQRQYIHAISNTASVAPTDIWKLSDSNIKPQQGNQISLGVYSNLRSNSIETSVEVYYKNIQNYLDYKSGAQLIMNHHLETDVIATQGKAYGAEFLIKKVKGKLNGWLSYTYSRILLRTKDPIAGELINGGNYYPANYDKPHDLTLVGNYHFTHRISTSLNVTYSTGRPITLPSAIYNYAGSLRTLYLERNGYRIPDYFRSDFSLGIEGNHKVYQKFHNSWSFGVYNLTARKNPYSVYFISEKGRTNGYQLSIFGSAIPFINFNIRF